MAEAHVIAICVAVAALALAAAVLGVVGEATKSKAPPSSRSNALVLRSVRRRELRVPSDAGVRLRDRRLLATVSAAAFVVGAFRSQSGERRRREDGVETYYRCTVLVAGVFAGASSLALLAAAVGIASYVALEAAAAAPCWEERRLGVAAAGQPEQGRRGHGCPSYGSNKTMLELFEDEAA
uniref:Uncharacterized protein n=1 Tax=Oryza sativa subsp. japonica TaxID=39947 RepID=Q2QV62_ORYSJ|nr:hypothetical protein LOC_Os12g13900 [Oryza sativa Japonica Group]